MSPRQILEDVARVYRVYGVGCARARLVYHGWSVDDPRLENMLSIAAELAERLASPSLRRHGVREEQVRQSAPIFSPQAQALHDG